MIFTFGLGGLGRTSAASDDPFSSGDVFLSHCDGADASTTLLDAKGHTMTAAGDAQIDTAQSKFGGASALFDGTGDFFTTPDSVDWYFAAGDFTVECWIRAPSATSASPRTIISQWAGTGNQRSWVLQLSTTGVVQFSYSTSGSSTTATASAASAISANTWYHVAVVRNGTSLVVYLEGVGGTSVNIATDTLFNSTTLMRIGTIESGGSAANLMNGWIDEIRITKGFARYTANFTPPSVPFT